MRMRRRDDACVWLLLVSLCSYLTAACHAQATPSPEFSADALEFFEKEVRPVLSEHCASCHSEQYGNTKGGLSLDSRAQALLGGESGAAVVPGEPDASLLIEAVRRESFEMPPEKPLPNKALQTLERWVALGAPWSPEMASDGQAEDWLEQRAASHWAWQPLAEAEVPRVPEDDWSEASLDRFILARLRDEGLQPSPSADSTTLLRRYCFDLTGLPPSRDQVRRYADLSTAEAREKCVDELLGSPQFGARWGRHWLDLVRYAETLGHEFDYPIHDAWRYRDSVVDAFNIDLPYRQLVVEHIAGDQLPLPRRHPLSGVNQALAATAWWWLGEALHAPVDIQSDWASRLDNQIDVFSKTFLGMTIACARCHDHKFDAIPVDDYYGLSGILESSRREYTLTDPDGAIAAHQREMQTQLRAADQRAAAATAGVTLSDMQAWLDRLLASLGELDEPQREERIAVDSPLVPLKLLLEESSEAEFAQRWQALQAQLVHAQREFAAWQAESRLFADFTDGIPPGWRFNRPAAIERQPGFEWFDDALPMPARPEVFSSARGGRQQSVALSSPTFDVSKTQVCVRLRGKAAQSSVVVGNYFMQEFHNLLFGDLRKPIDQPNELGWVVHAGDLNKYIGQPAYLTFEDTGAAWFELQQVWFADRPPPRQPHPVALHLLDRPLPSREALAQYLAREFYEAVRAGAAAEPRPAELARALVRIALSQSVPLPLPASESLRASAAALAQHDARAPAPTVLLSIQEGTPRDASVALRGNPHDRGALVPRTCLARIVEVPAVATDSSGRWELATALVAPQHPLTARVMVNRVWQHLMGRGIVSTPDNLGVLGGRPTHPQLLDFLARRFMENNWSIKWLVREIALSRTYRLGSQMSAAQRELDAEGSLWSYRPVRRLEAEALRDAMLATADSLDLQMSGASVPVHLTDKMTGRGRPKDSGPLDGDNRRTLFIEVRRNFLDPLLMAFDFPMPATTTGNRNASNVPAQALGLLNDPLIHEVSRRWAKRTASVSDPRQRIAVMIEAAYSRPATEFELQQCLTFIEQGEPAAEAWEALAHVLLNAKEFSFLR